MYELLQRKKEAGRLGAESPRAASARVSHARRLQRRAASYGEGHAVTSSRAGGAPIPEAVSRITGLPLQGAAGIEALDSLAGTGLVSRGASSTLGGVSAVTAAVTHDPILEGAAGVGERAAVGGADLAFGAAAAAATAPVAALDQFTGGHLSRTVGAGAQGALVGLDAAITGDIAGMEEYSDRVRSGESGLIAQGAGHLGHHFGSSLGMAVYGDHDTTEHGRCTGDRRGVAECMKAAAMPLSPEQKKEREEMLRRGKAARDVRLRRTYLERAKQFGFMHLGVSAADKGAAMLERAKRLAELDGHPDIFQ